MAINTLKGIAKAGAIYQDRTQRVITLQKEGRKVFGYLCIYPITEMLTALDIVPFRLFGDIDEPITKANNFLPTVVCPFLRSFLDLGLKGKYNFLDGMITSHICDVGAGIPAIWNYAVSLCLMLIIWICLILCVQAPRTITVSFWTLFNCHWNNIPGKN